MQKQEIWRQIPNYEGYYEASSFGRIKSVHYGRVFKGYKHRQGYIRIDLTKSGARIRTTVHQLVATTFLGHEIGKGLVVDHIDNNPSNNHLENLQVITQRENCVKELKGLIGAIWVKNRGNWQSWIWIKGVRVYLGTFNTDIEAHEAYTNKLKEINEG